MKCYTEEEIERMRADTRGILRSIRESRGYAREKAKFASDYSVAREMDRARKRAKLTQAEIAARMGTSQSDISRMMRSNVTVRKLARYFEVCGAKMVIKANFS